MKLLIVTQKVDQDDPILGFFHGWIEEFAKRCEQLTVICLEKGAYAFPSHVHVLSLGKEERHSRWQYLFRFYRYLSRERHNYDAVFVHMNAEYVVLGGLFWRMWGKKIALWYTHKSVTLRLRLAVLLADYVFTASKESFRQKTRKLRILGHGINVALFRPASHITGDLKIITVGRISPTKQLLDILPALDLLYAHGRHFSFTIVGAPVTGRDIRYGELLRREITKRPYAHQINFRGPVAYRELPPLFRESNVNINLSKTGSMDKAVLDGFAAQVPAVSSNIAFKDILAPHGLFINDLSPLPLAEAIEKAAQTPGKPFRRYVLENHSLPQLIDRVIRFLFLP